ncbi:tail fiber domain-containing protein [Agrobacterium tumefaciens]|uniref:tail fiber domain-containing protein n=1 Tax=Agrobacterium tumefaciens TaxID=358 RepID=UPI001572322E|nr:tail fiber domain-containing protein [Agrobacterium tumefaciens]NTB01071.1 tail fiber domain-containing protein [Agrobacterium tumefaciens]
MVSTPKPESAASQAAAQSGLNRDTALTQQQVNMINQVTPDGTLTYNKTGESSFVDSTGKTVTTPTYTATTSLSGQQQAIKDQTDAASLNLGTIANQQSSFLKDYLAKPFKADTAEAEARLAELGSARLDPRFAQEDEALRTRLANQGIVEGSAAWNSAMSNQSQSKNDAYNQLYLTGRSQALSEAYAERNQPLQEISSLLSGAQVQNPQFNSTPQASVAGVDYIGASNNNYNAQVSAANAKMGGLFGLLGTGLTAGIKYSDRRLKTDVRRVGSLDNGLPVYAYRMIGSPVTEIGLMADDVENKMPDAVHQQPNGFKMVDYRVATEAA